MARLPTPGSDNGTWGNVLNDYLLQTLKPDGTLKENAVTASNLAPNSVTNSALASNAVNASIIADGSITETLLDSALQAKVNASSGSVTSVAGKTGIVTLDKSDVGLGNIDNTSDATKNSAATTLTNKTIDSPRINTINDTNGNHILTLSPNINADTYVSIINTNWQQAIIAASSDTQTNTSLVLRPMGTGTTNIWSAQPTLFADGPNANHDLNLTTKGTGVVKANGIDVATVSDAQTLTNKTISGSTNTISNIAQTSITNLTTDLAAKAADSTVVHNSGNETIAGAKTFTSSAFVGDGTASTYLTVQGTAYNGVDTNVFSDTASPYSFFRRYKGTKASPAQVTSGSYIGSFGFRAANETGATNNQDGARFSAITEEDVTSSSQATSLIFYTAASGSISPSERMRIKGNGDVTILSPGTSSTSAVTVGATQSLTNKTLINPRVGEILDATNGKTAFATHAAANAVNFIYSYGNNSGESPQLAVSGGDTNVHLDIVPKGTGHLRVNTLTGSTSIISAEGPGTNQNLDLLSKGTGEVRANGARIITDSMLTDYSQLVCLTAPGATGTEDGSDTWAKVVTFSTGATQYAEAQLVLSVANRNSGQHDTAIVSVYFRTNSTGQDPIVDVKMIAKGGDGVGIRNDSFKVISGGWSTDMELWMKKGGTYGRFAVYETSKNLEGGALIYTSNAPWQSATPVGTVNNVSSNGVQSGLSLRVNGSLSVSDGIKDTNGNPSLDLGTIPNAVNRIYIDNQSTGNYPTIGATGPDTDIGIALAPKNNGPVNLFGNAPTIAAAGGANGGNLNLNLKSQGTGVVQANGNPVTTSKMRYPMYSDSSTYFEPWPQLMCYGGNWVLASGDLPLTFFTPAVNMTVSNIITMGWNDTTHTNATECKVAIYRVDDVFSGGNKMECIARSGHKADRWNGSVLDTAPIVDNGAASPSAISSVNLIAGQQYAIGYMSIGHTGTPKLSALGTFRKNTLLPLVGYFGDGGHSSMPVYVTSGWIEEWTYIWFALS
jgi:hypothetical protein